MSAHKHTAPPLLTALHPQLNNYSALAHNHRAPSHRQPPNLLKHLKTSAKNSSDIIQLPPTNSINREQKRKENIIILCDSNGHHLNHRRLFPGRSQKFWCPTSQSALRLLLREGVLGTPSHIILHTGTNDLNTRRLDVTTALTGAVKAASRI